MPRPRRDRIIAAAAIFLLMLIAPLRDALARAGAPACAAASCCASKTHGCPMHGHGSHDRCRLSSCGEHREASVRTPPIARSRAMPPPIAHPPSSETSRREAAVVVHIAAPPDPPPPRRG